MLQSAVPVPGVVSRRFESVEVLADGRSIATTWAQLHRTLPTFSRWLQWWGLIGADLAAHKGRTLSLRVSGLEVEVVVEESSTYVSDVLGVGPAPF